MKYTCTRTCGFYRKGHEYDLEIPLPVLAVSAIRRGYLVAASGWCAPSEVVYSQVNALGEELLDMPSILADKLADEVGKTTPKPRKRVKKVAAKPDTLESLAEQTAKGLEDLRGPSGP